MAQSQINTGPRDFSNFDANQQATLDKLKSEGYTREQILNSYNNLRAPGTNQQMLPFSGNLKTAFDKTFPEQNQKLNNAFMDAKKNAETFKIEQQARYSDDTPVNIAGLGVVNQGTLNSMIDNTKRDLFKSSLNTQLTDLKNQVSTPQSIYSRNINRDSVDRVFGNINKSLNIPQQSLLPEKTPFQEGRDISSSLKNEKAMNRLNNAPLPPEEPQAPSSEGLSMEKHNQQLRNDYQRALEEEWMEPIIEATKNAPQNMTPAQQQQYLEAVIQGVKSSKGNPNTWTSRVAGYTPSESARFDALLSKGITPATVGRMNITNGKNQSLNPIDQEKFKKYYETIGGVPSPSYIEGSITDSSGNKRVVKNTAITEEFDNYSGESTSEMIKRFEGFEEVPYKDIDGSWVSGYGVKLTPSQIKKYVPNGNPQAMPKEELESMYDKAYKQAEAAAIKMMPDKAPKGLQKVLTGMVYQMGEQGTRGFVEMGKAIKAGDYEKAADEMLDSEWAKQTPARAEFMSRLMRKLARGEVTPEQAQAEVEAMTPTRDTEGERKVSAMGSMMDALSVGSDTPKSPAKGSTPPVSDSKEGKLSSVPGNDPEGNVAGRFGEFMSKAGDTIQEGWEAVTTKPTGPDDLKWYNSSSFGQSLMRFGLGLLSGEKLATAFDNGAREFTNNFNREQRSMWVNSDAAKEKYTKQQRLAFEQTGDPKYLKTEAQDQWVTKNTPELGLHQVNLKDGTLKQLTTPKKEVEYQVINHPQLGLVQVSSTGEVKQLDDKAQGGGYSDILEDERIGLYQLDKDGQVKPITTIKPESQYVTRTDANGNTYQVDLTTGKRIEAIQSETSEIVEKGGVKYLKTGNKLEVLPEHAQGKGKFSDLKGEQAKALGYVGRMSLAEKELGKFTETNPTKAAETMSLLDSLGEGAIIDAMFSGNGTAEATFKNKYPEAYDRMLIERNFITSLLRKESGAAVTAQEWKTYGSQFMPRHGDSQEALDRKARARKMAVAGIRSEYDPMMAEVLGGVVSGEYLDFYEDKGQMYVQSATEVDEKGMPVWYEVQE